MWLPDKRKICKRGKTMEDTTVYHLGPVIRDRVPIKIIDVEDLFVRDSHFGQIGFDGETKTPELYVRLRAIPNP